MCGLVSSCPMRQARLVHVTTTDMSLVLLLGPQLRAFKAAGYDVVTCSASGPYVRELESWGIKHVALRHATRASDPVADLLTLRELTGVFRELRPDIVHTHNPKPGVLGRVAARICRVPVIVNTVHGLYAQESDPLLRRLVVYGAERVASICSSAELVQNPEDLATLSRLGVPRGKLTLLGNGVDLNRFSTDNVTSARAEVRHEFGAASSDVVVGVVGRLVWEKGYREVFAAAERWARASSAMKVVVVGPPDVGKADAIDEISIEQAKARGVCFLGERADMERLYAGFDIYVLASYREGFPRSAMEAAAMGLPVVATNIRGCREVVDHGVTGLLVRPGDSVALADAVLRLAASPSERAAMGQEGRDKARREFDQQQVMDTTMRVYERLLGRSVVRHTGPREFELRLARPSDAATLAELHCSELGKSFIASLGRGFLRKLYRRVIRSPESFVVIASGVGLPVAGFVAGTTSTRALYRRFVLHDGLVAGLVALPSLLRAPHRVLETFRYVSSPTSPSNDLPPAELLSLAVDGRARRRGLGESLVRACLNELADRDASTSRVVVDSSNETAIKLYKRCGYRDEASFELHPGKRSAVLVWP